MLRVDYNNKEWIERFITEVLTDEDFIEIASADSGRLVLAKKLGYTRVSGTYVFHNQHGEVEEDYNMKKLIHIVENNDVYNNRFIIAMKDLVNK